MKRKILTFAAVAMAALGVLALFPASVNADSACDAFVEQYTKQGKDPKENPAYESICGSAKGEEDAKAVVKSVLSTVFTWTGIISVIVVIIGGVFYITSQGEPDKIKRAKNAILYAVIGLIISLLSFAIVNFVLTAMQGS